MIVEPFPFIAPITFAVGAAVHVNVVPITLEGDRVMVMVAKSPLQITVLEAVAVGNGRTNTTRSMLGPLQPL